MKNGRKNAARGRHFSEHSKLVIRVLALLVRDAAAGLAGRLAGSLALAAAAVLGALAKIPGLQSDDSLHNLISYLKLPMGGPRVILILKNN